MTGRRRPPVRRALALALSLLIPAGLVLGFEGAGVRMTRNLLLPGIGLIDGHLVVAALALAGAIAAIVMWLAWGVDWLPIAVVAASTIAAGVLTPGASTSPSSATDLVPVAAAHEFPLVVLVVGVVAWVRNRAARLPGARHLAARRTRSMEGLSDLPRLGPVDRSRAVTICVLAGADAHERTMLSSTLQVPDVARRARLVGGWARARLAGDPFRVDHAHARAALALVGDHAEDHLARLAADAVNAPAGVPASEPTWVRPLDATLAAAALARSGSPGPGLRWSEMLAGPFALRRGHRPACWWTPLEVPIGSASVWEHTASTGIARAHGWCTDDDWPALRARCLGAAARGIASPDDERTIAAARIWLAFVDDEQAARILSRPTVRRDPLAVALDRLAGRLVTTPSLLATSTCCVSSASSASSPQDVPEPSQQDSPRHPQQDSPQDSPQEGDLVP
jgi:hypothetical protein